MFTTAMKFLMGALLVPAALSHATPKRDLFTILQRMNIVAVDIMEMNSTLNSLKPGLLALPVALKIQSQQSQINKDINGTINAITTSTTLDATDSQRLVDESDFHGQLIRSLLGNIVRHKPAFETALLIVGDLSQSVHEALIVGKNYTQNFATAAQGVVSAGYKIPETDLVGSWDAAIAAYEKCGGLLCLPPF